MRAAEIRLHRTRLRIRMRLTLITPAPMFRCSQISEGMVVAVGPGGRTADGDVIPMAVQVGHPGDARVRKRSRPSPQRTIHARAASDTSSTRRFALAHAQPHPLSHLCDLACVPMISARRGIRCSCPSTAATRSRSTTRSECWAHRACAFATGYTARTHSNQTDDDRSCTALCLCVHSQDDVVSGGRAPRRARGGEEVRGAVAVIWRGDDGSWAKGGRVNVTWLPLGGFALD